MDGNKDEALKCLNIARGAIGSGDRTRALKFIAKALRLDPSLSLSASDLLPILDAQPEPTTESSPPPSARPRVRVSESPQCLSNEESRKRYKFVGSDEEVFEQGFLIWTLMLRRYSGTSLMEV